MNTKKKVYVGLSGGVDSSVAALLLIEMGYEVTGVFMKNWSDCDWISEERWAKKAAAHMGIPMETWDFEKEYKEKVLSNFYDEYKNGRTPNPDILCNKFIKFDLFLRRALEEGADIIATGHYAKVADTTLYRGHDVNKDQSYFLYTLTKDQLSHVLFPLEDLTKPQVRELAKNAKLPNSDKKDSQGICFVGAIDVKSFLEKNIGKKPGNIIDVEGTVLGSHDGVQFYTEGQREGLFLGGLKQPHYIAFKDMKDNILIATEKDHPLLYTKKVIVKNVHITNGKTLPEKVCVKIRYRQPDQKATVVQNGHDLEITFDELQYSVSEGQSAVLYKGNEVLGGGIIDYVERDEALVELIKKRFNESHAISRN